MNLVEAKEEYQTIYANVYGKEKADKVLFLS